MDPLGVGIALGAALLLAMVAIVVVLARSAVAVPPDQALVVNQLARTRVCHQPAFVFPFVAHGELVDLRAKTIVVQRRGRESLSCRDGVRAEIDVELTVAVERTDAAILKVAQSFGAARTFDAEAVRAAFEGRLVEALASVAVMFDADELVRHREELGERVLEVLGRDLDGFVVQDLAVPRIEQAPREAHDPANIRDARGITRITEETVREATRTADLERDLRLRQAQLRTDTEIRIAELLAQRTEAFAHLEEGTGARIDLDAVEREIDERVRRLAQASAEPPA